MNPLRNPVPTRRRLVAATASIVVAPLALAGCSAASSRDSSDTAPTSAPVVVEGSLTAEQVLADNTTAHSAQTAAATAATDILLKGRTASTTGDDVDIDGSTVTITAGGTYRLAGTLTNGQVLIKADDQTVHLILDGVAISSSKGAAIAATKADELVVTLAAGTKNSLADADSYAQDVDANAALFSAGDLTIAGSGSLTVRGNGNDGIASKDGLVISSGTTTVTAEDDGIRGKDYLVVNGGTVAVTSGGDGLKADSEDADAGYVSLTGGTVKITAGGDGIDAASDLVLTGGQLTATTGGGSKVAPKDDTSTKGLKSGVITVLQGGTANVDASDDAVHSDGAVHLNGTNLTAATGDDGIHADAALVVDRGNVTVTTAVEGVEGAHIVVNGGSVQITSSDDGVNAAGGTTEAETDQGGGPGGGRGGGEAVQDVSVQITGGTLVIDAQGDGLDSNGTASISGGTVVVNGPEQNGNGALDVNGSFIISGGQLLAAGSAGMAVAPATESPQAWLSVTFDSAVPAGTTVQVVSHKDVVATFVTSKSVQNVVYSSADIASGQEYAIYVGGTASGANTGGLAESGSVGSATKTATVTAGEAPAGGRGFGRR